MGNGYDMEKTTFEPRILAFCCHYCAYAAADLAGTMRIQYPPNVRIIRTPCTGRLETEFLIKAFETGADGVFVAGCLEGGCHYTSGNLYARRRIEYMREMLEEMGLEKDRLRMVNVSAAGGRLLADYITEMVETIRRLGPSPVHRKGRKTEDREQETEDGVVARLNSAIANRKCKVEKTS
jgi:F420-non-reducing hydrogenase iron-sulfur subunit